MKKNKIIIPIMIIIILLLLCAGALAYIYLETDLFKSTPEMFLENADFAIVGIKDFIKDESLKQYMQKKQYTPYENEGTINIKTNSSASNFALDLVSFKGAVDNANEKVEENISLNFSNTVSMPISFVRNEDLYGLTSSEVVNKYLTVENKNLKAFAAKFGITNENIPDVIELKEGQEFTEEEIDTFINTYLNIIKNNVTEEDFSKDESSSLPGYVLTISGEKLKIIKSQILTQLKDDRIITSRIGEYLDSYQDEIDDLIAEINEEDYSEKYVKITMYTSSSSSLSFKIETEEYSTNVKLSATNINIVFVPVTEESDVTSETINLSKNSTASSVSYELSISTEGENAANIIITMDLTGIATDDVTEKYNIEFNDDNGEIVLTYSNSLNYKNAVQITELNEENSVVLNDYPDEDLLGLMSALSTQINTVLTEKLTAIMNDKNSVMGLINSFSALMMNSQGSLEMNSNM